MKKESTLKIIRPRIKPSHPVLHHDTAVCIGEIPGCASIIRKPAPWLGALIDLLDGTHTHEDLYHALASKGFSLTYDEMNFVLGKFQELAFLEEGTLKSTSLDENELERYHRQMIYYSLIEKECQNGFHYQEQLKKQNIAIFGVGGWGSWMALNLCSLGVGKLTLIDDDVIELSNLNRQVLFGTDDIGKSKVDVAAKKLRLLNPHVSIDAIQKRIEPSYKDIKNLIKDCTFVVLAWTNLSYFKPNTPVEIIHQIAIANNLPVIEIGADPLFVSVGPIFPNNRKSACFECIKKQVLKEHYSQDPLVRAFQEDRMVRNRKNLGNLLKSYQSAPSLSAMAGLATDQMVKYITDCEKSNLLGNQFKLSLQTHETTHVKFNSNPDCVNCGSNCKKPIAYV